MGVLVMGLRLSTRASQRFTLLLLSTAPQMRCTDYAICGLCSPNLMSMVLPRPLKERSKALRGRRCFKTSTDAWPEKPLRDLLAFGVVTCLFKKRCTYGESRWEI
jgi:hypothetical protein